MATIKMSESELEQLSRDIGTQQQHLRDIISQVRSAVSGTDWQSAAAESFKQRWALNQRTLEELESRLQEWARKCREHSQIAHETNKRFL